MLQLDDLALRRGAKLLFDGANLQIHPGQRVGVTGANGTGKSSLFALIRGQLHPDAGDCRLPADWVIAHVEQETEASGRSAVDYVLDGDRELRAVEAEIERAEGGRLGELHGRLEAIGGYRARSRAAQLLHGLGFSGADEQRPVRDFSGGWRVRLNLGRALMCRSDLLLLDEPTNHLDLDAVIWLEGWLRAYPGTLLLISHDRDFLDAVTSHIAHIEQGRLSLYPGNYSAFERIRSERLANQQAEHEKQVREIAHIRGFVDRFRAKATKARQAQSRLKALERMELIAPAHVDSPFHFRFRAPRRLPTPLLQLDRAASGYGEKPVVTDVRLTLTPGDRIGLLGPNGAGKSTLIKLLAGELGCLAGRREPAPELGVGYFAQHQLEQLHPEHSPLEHLAQVEEQSGGAATEQALRDFLGGFGFAGDQALARVAPFSGGEKSRLALALIVYRRPNLLLLDEPTNHLDLEMRQALAQALQEFDGAMVIVSHDRHLLRVSTDELLLVHGGRVEPFTESLDDYPAWLSRAARANTGSQDAPAGSPGRAGAGGANAAERRARRRAEAARRQSLQPLRKRVAALEQRLDRLHHRGAEIERGLADPEIYADAHKARLQELLAEKRELDSEQERVEHDCLEAMEALEAAETERD